MGDFFRTYDSFLSFYFGNEYLIQLFLAGLFILPWKRRRTYFLLRFLLSSAVYFAVGIFLPAVMPWYYLYMFLIYLALMQIGFSLDPIECLFFGCNIYCFQFIVSDLSYAVNFGLLLAGSDSFVPLYVTAYVLLAGGGAALRYWYFRKLGSGKIRINSPLVLFAVFIFLVVSVFLTHYIPLAIGYEDLAAHAYVKLFAALFGGAILMVNVMNNRNTELNRDKQILQLLLQKDKEEYERARLNEEQLNIKYHDMKKAARLGIRDEDEQTEIPHRYFTGNRALDIILGAESLVCEKNGIRLLCTADGELLNTLQMRSYHIYSMMSNLLDNAVESLVKVPDGGKREIRMSVQRRGGMCVIEVQNFTADAPVIRDELPQTTKSDRENHGFGSKSVRHIAETYGGSVRFSVEDSIFTALVVLPLPERKIAAN